MLGDALLLSRLAEAVFVCVEVPRVTRSMLDGLRRALTNARARTLGFVVTGDLGVASEYGYGYGYGNGYGSAPEVAAGGRCTGEAGNGRSPVTRSLGSPVTRLATDGPTTSSRLRSGLVYAGAAGLQRASIFLLLPFVTRVMSPAEYGRLSLVLSAASAASIFFACGLDLAIFRTFFQLADDPRAQRRYVNSLWVFLVVMPMAGAAVLTGALIPFAQAPRSVWSSWLSA